VAADRLVPPLSRLHPGQELFIGHRMIATVSDAAMPTQIQPGDLPRPFVAHPQAFHDGVKIDLYDRMK
jgi:hypothetical protein